MKRNEKYTAYDEFAKTFHYDVFLMIEPLRPTRENMDFERTTRIQIALINSWL